jgi:serine/threonine protein kinase
VLRSRRTEGAFALSLDESASFTAPSAFGPFRVLHQIGSGVLGPVFRTYDPQRDRLIAVKAFRLDLVPEDVARLAEAFRRLAAASPSHPGLVPAVDGGLEGATAFLAMDYIAGETLDVAFRHLAPAPLDRALPVLTQIADALDAGWAAGLGHGALHPRDVFLTAGANEVRVTGIGVVPALESTGVKAPVRRPYTAPERAAGEPWDVRADVYSLGAIAHELLTRRRPAGPGEQDGALATGLTPEQRVHVRRILSAALSERPEYRFATPKAFGDALAAVARGEAPVLPPEPEIIATLPTEKSAARKRGPAMTPLLEAIEPPPADAPIAVIPVPSVPPASPENPTETPLSHFDSERRREPPPPEPAPVAAREATPEPIVPPPAAIERAPLVIEESEAVAAATIHRPEPFTTRARSVPPPFMTSPPESPAFPWAAFGAVAIACIIAGGVGGYTIGVHRAPSAAEPAGAPPAGRPTADTDVSLPPTPLTTPVPEPVTPHPAPPASAEQIAPPEKPTPTSKPASTPAQGTLIVRSSPPGALVTIDGHAHGMTPATVRELLLGSHTLQVARPGYVPSSQPIVLTSAQSSKEITVELQASADTRPAQAGSIFVDTRPRGARVLIDGHVVGTTPVRARPIAPGQHAVRIEMDGYKPVSTTVDVKSGTEVPVAVTLELVGQQVPWVPRGSTRFPGVPQGSKR